MEFGHDLGSFRLFSVIKRLAIQRPSNPLQREDKAEKPTASVAAKRRKKQSEGRGGGRGNDDRDDDEQSSASSRSNAKSRNANQCCWDFSRVKGVRKDTGVRALSLGIPKAARNSFYSRQH